MDNIFARIALYSIYGWLFFISLFSSYPDKWVGVGISLLFLFLSHLATKAKPAPSSKAALD
ncbi:hypothetical protein ACUXAC_005203 [Serratia sp. 121840015-1]